MKKLLAIALTLMLLTASAALAENASTFTLSDPVLSVTSDGQTQQVDMAGVTLTLSAGMSGDTPAVQFDITGAKGSLLSGEMRVEDSNLLLMLDGLSRPISMDISAGGEQVEDGLQTAFEALPNTGSLNLPAYKGMTVPKLSLLSYVNSVPLLLMFIDTKDIENGIYFNLPYDTVMWLLGYLEEFKSFVPESAAPYANLLFDAIDDMNQTGNGFALQGSLTDDGLTCRLVVDVLPVVNKQASDAPFASLDAQFAENLVNINVDTYTDSVPEDLFDLSLISVPSKAELSFALKLMNAMDVTGSLYPDGDMQVVAVELNADGQVIDMSYEYGKLDKADYAQFIMSIPEQVALQVETKTVSKKKTGNTKGTLSLTAETYEPGAETAITLDANISGAPADVVFRDIDTSAGVYDPTKLTEEEGAQLTNELNSALNGLLEGLIGLVPAA